MSDAHVSDGPGLGWPQTYPRARAIGCGPCPAVAAHPTANSARTTHRRSIIRDCTPASRWSLPQRSASCGVATEVTCPLALEGGSASEEHFFDRRRGHGDLAAYETRWHHSGDNTRRVRDVRSAEASHASVTPIVTSCLRAYLPRPRAIQPSVSSRRTDEEPTSSESCFSRVLSLAGPICRAQRSRSSSKIASPSRITAKPSLVT